MRLKSARSGRRSLIVCQSHHIALLCFQGACRRFGRLHYFITGFGFCKPPRRFFVNFFSFTPRDFGSPSGDILKLSRLSVFASGRGDFFSPRARPDGQATRISGMSVPFPFRHSPIMSLPSVPCGTVRRARRGAGQKKATGAPTGLLPAGVRRGEVWRRGQKSPSSGLAATGCLRMS